MSQRLDPSGQILSESLMVVVRGTLAPDHQRTARCAYRLGSETGEVMETRELIKDLDPAPGIPESDDVDVPDSVDDELAEILI